MDEIDYNFLNGNYGPPAEDKVAKEEVPALLKFIGGAYWQSCPVCAGTGSSWGAYSQRQCHVCKGHGIISVLTGLPPNFIKNGTITSNGTIASTNITINKSDELNNKP